ncbi:thiamine-binding protein [Gulosibacter bifidus]|uniref:MTH1187 family thiamine-binding protein n=1 Tax=Gulosibacter bifidus TaxID=272239 RepID=A0ABW5RG05_9MICO|nr:thiamine-binding protein [Gulosibacter bifidus]
MIAAISIAPSGPASDPTVTPDAPGSYTNAVAAMVKVIRASGLPNETSAMFTSIEGEWDEVMAVVKAACDEAGRFGNRVSLVLKADIRQDAAGNEMQGKVDRVERAIVASSESN